MKSKRLGRVAFFLPLVVMVVLAGYFWASLNTGSGVVVVKATGGSAQHPVSLTVAVSIQGSSHVTPFNLTLPAGAYILGFQTMPWYHPPYDRSVTVLSGKTAYVLEVYQPIATVVAIGPAGPNSTVVNAEHGVTPVVWMNNGSGPLELISTQFGAQLSPGGNYTTTFQSSGTFQVDVMPGDYVVTVHVS